VLAAALCALAAPAGALERDVVVRFLPPDGPEAAGYELYLVDVETGVEDAVDLGFVVPDVDGVARATLALDAARTWRVQMTAYNGSGRSERSNEIVIEAEAGACDASLCDDANPCTVDWCDSLGCASEPVQDGTACDDGFADTVDDQCVQGTCEGLLLGCVYDADCDDGNFCNGLEVCAGAGGCVEGPAPSCGEPTACTAPGCTPEGGCFTELAADGTPCDDGRGETSEDVCLAGVCEGIVTGPAPALAVDALVPAAVAPGLVAIEVHGAGFVPGAFLSFQNGAGKAPRVQALELVDDGLLVATVEVYANGPRRSRYFDVLIELPDGTRAWLAEGLRIDP